MERAQITAIVDAAVRRLVDKNSALLDLDVNEQAIAHHLAVCIQEAVPADLNVDVEYNKHGNEKKVLLLPPKGSLDQTPIPTLVRPDIVVHIRGSDVRNILALEVKKPGEDIAYDRVKLRALKEQYGYLYAAHVIVGILNGHVIREVLWV